jgi:hypothetical protein
MMVEIFSNNCTFAPRQKKEKKIGMCYACLRVHVLRVHVLRVHVLRVHVLRVHVLRVYVLRVCARGAPGTWR